MNKRYGAEERHDTFIKFNTGRAVLIYGYGEDENGRYDWRHTFDHYSSINEVIDIANNFINKLTAEKILTGYQWEGINVYLSSENQFNFKVAHDIAVQSKGKTLPLTFKLGEDADGTPQYYTFESLSSIKEFYKGAVEFIQKTLADGWKEKDAVRNMIMNS